MRALWQTFFQFLPMEFRVIFLGLLAILVVFIIFKLVKIVLDSLPFL